MYCSQNVFFPSSKHHNVLSYSQIVDYVITVRSGLCRDRVNRLHFGVEQLRYLPSKSDILCIFAHGDDETYMIGSLLRFLQEGKNVQLVYLTQGEYGTDILGEYAKGNEIQMARLIDMQILVQGFTLFGGIAKPLMLNFPDGKLSLVEKQAIKVVQHIIDYLHPHQIYTFGQEGKSGHVDHIAVHQIVQMCTAKCDINRIGHTEEECRTYRQAIKGRNRLATSFCCKSNAFWTYSIDIDKARSIAYLLASHIRSLYPEEIASYVMLKMEMGESFYRQIE